MTDPRPLLSAIARLTKERDDYRDLCRDFSGAESPETLVAALRDRQRMEAEIASLKADLAAAEEVARKAVQAIPVAMDAAVAKEREACAKIADDERAPALAHDAVARQQYRTAQNIAAAIRARRDGGDHG
jgi:hypothetical protein